MVYPGQYAQGQAPAPSSPAAANVRQPQIRAKGPDSAPPTPQAMPRPQQVGVPPSRLEPVALTMPRPEQLGVSMPRPEQLAVPVPNPPAHSAAAGGVDWKATRDRLAELKATSFALS